MMPSIQRRELLAAGAGAGMLALAGCVSQSLDGEETVTREFDAATVDAVDVTTENGDIDLRGEETDTVTVEARKRADDEDSLDDVEVSIGTDGGVLTVEGEGDDGGLLSLFRATPRVDFDLVVPATLASAETTSTNGDIAIEAVDSDVTADTTNGDITMQGDDGEVTAGTTNGDIDLDLHAPGEVTAETTNGDVFVGMAEPSDVTVDTTNGDVELVVPATAEPEIVFETTNGSLTVEGLDAGSVDADGSTETTIGAGTHRIEVETTNGNLDIRGRAA